VRRWLLGRLLQAVGVVLIVATLTFVLLHLAPGDPFAGTLDDPRVSEAVRQRMRAQFGLDRPIHEQYLRWIASAARGDLGWSLSLNRPVRDVMLDALPNTLLLMGVALAGSFLVGVLAGVYSAMRRGSLGDHLSRGVLLFVYSIPDFWLALMAMLVFAVWLRAAPVSGMVDPVMHGYLGPMDRLLDRLQHLWLPAGTLVLLGAASIARHQRAAMLDVTGEDYVRTARAKGLSESRVVWRHAFRNALLPVITILGLALPALVAGAFFVEKIFAWPGMGYTIVRAISMRDYHLVTAGAVVIAAMVAVGNLLADLLYLAADPRLRRG
jgi:peptide/nickel transport system permease protein